MAIALGVDIGGTGIKAGIVDTATGELRSERLKLPTPKGGEPDAIVATVNEIIAKLGGVPEGAPVGVAFPAIIIRGVTLSAAHVSKKWIGLDAERVFEAGLGRAIHFTNDADAAGYAEVHYGAARGVNGLVLLTTLGTGIGTALIFNGQLIPNAELGHIEINGRDAERIAAYSAKDRGHWSYKRWAKNLQLYYSTIESLLSPDLIIVGGGVSKSFEEFLPLLKLRAPIVPAVLRNNAGILGAAALAVRDR